MNEVTLLKRGGQRVEVQSSLVTTETLRRSFRVDPGEVWLKREVDNRAFFPNETGHFNLGDLHMGNCILNVEGPDALSTPGPGSRVSISSTSQSTSLGTSSSYVSTPRPETPTFRSVIPKKAIPTASVKILKGTRGLKFWKSPRRKVFAVRKSLVKKGKKRSYSDYLSAGDESDEEAPHVQHKRKDITVDEVRDDVWRIESKVDALTSDLTSVKSDLVEILRLNASSNIPLGLQRLIRCLSVPMSPPVVMSNLFLTDTKNVIQDGSSGQAEAEVH